MGDVQTALHALSEQTREILPSIPDLSDEQLARVLLVYRALVEPYFIPMLAYTFPKCRSSVAREACRSNLLCEVSEDHPRMLNDFVKPALAHLDEQSVGWYIRARGGASQIIEPLMAPARFPRTFILNALVTLAALETTSQVFIPWLAEAAKRLGATDFTYTEKHGIADIAHADEFAKAVEAEAQTVDDPAGSQFVALDDALPKVFSFLSLIFRVP
jgi:hypothetical protein